MTLLIWLYIFIGIIFCISLFPLGLILRHKFGKFCPHWTFGDTPESQVNIYYRSKKPENLAVRYNIINEKQSKIQDEVDIVISDENTPIFKLNLDGAFISSKQKKHNHYFALRNLPAGSEFTYNIFRKYSNSKILAKGKFKTQAEVPSSDFKFVAFGDMQIAENLEIIESYLTHLIQKNKPDLILSMGDNVHSFESIKDWKIYHTILRKIIPFVPYYNTPGNHDYGSDNGKTLVIDAQNFPINKNNCWFYSFSFGKVKFVSILSRQLFNKNLQSKQMEFLEDILKQADIDRKNGKINWIIFFSHVPWWGPAYNKQNSMEKEEEYIRNNWVPIMEKYGVDLYFSGHKHSYCRDHNKIITASMHGVRDYPEATTKDYFLRNSHQFCAVSVSENKLSVEVKTWFNRNIEVYEIKKKCINIDF